MPVCKNCKRELNWFKIEQVDGDFICHTCLYKDHEPYLIYPIGFVENDLERKDRFGLSGSKSVISKIQLFHTQKPFLYKLEDERWITVVFYFHKQRKIQSVFPRGVDHKEVGIFSSRTPERLSRLGISNVELVKIEGTTLFVKNFDAINGTPILDIKLGRKHKKF